MSIERSKTLDCENLMTSAKRALASRSAAALLGFCGRKLLVWGGGGRKGRFFVMQHCTTDDLFRRYDERVIDEMVPAVAVAPNANTS